MSSRPTKPYGKNSIIFYVFIVVAIIYLGYAILEGGVQYQKEKRSATDEYREVYITKVDTFRTLQEQQINDFLRYYENQAGDDAITLMESYGEDLLATEREKMRYFAVTEPPADFVGYQAHSYLASSLIAEGLTTMLESNTGEGRDFDAGVIMLERGLEMMKRVDERYNTAKNLHEVQEEVEK